MLCFVVVSWVLSIRLARLWSRSRANPELCLCVQYVCVGCLGYPLAALGPALGEGLGVTVGAPVMIAAMALVRAGVAAAFFFTWQSFRPNEGWARWLAYAGALVLGVTFIDPIRQALSATDFSEIARSAGGGDLVVTVLVSGLVYSWSSFEAIHHWRQARRRLEIGLADPVVVDRLLLWGFVVTTSAFVSFYNLATIVAGHNLLTFRPALLISACSGLVCATLLILAFVPPKTYLAWVRDRAAGAA